LQRCGHDLNQLISEFLDQREQKIEQEKQAIVRAQELEATGGRAPAEWEEIDRELGVMTIIIPPSRYISVRTKNVLKEDVLRRMVRSWPLPLIRVLCLVLGAVSRVLLNYPYRALRALRPASPLLARFSMRDYADYPFSVTVNDLFDWLATPRNEYYRREDVLGWCEREGLQDIQVLNHFGWRAFGWTPGPGRTEGRRDGVAAPCAG
jgi:hypothetical protein